MENLLQRCGFCVFFAISLDWGLIGGSLIFQLCFFCCLKMLYPQVIFCLWGSYHIAAKSAICIILSADFLIIVIKTVSYTFCKKRSLIKKLSIESSSFDNKPSIYKTKSIDSFLSVFLSYH